MGDERPAEHRPGIEPGQIWLIEHDPGGALCALDRDALTSANVVIYDRALAPLVAELLPIHSYAEPLAQEHHADCGISRRALGFAATGWSVVQLVSARREGRDCLQVPPPVSRDVPVQVITKAEPAANRAADVANLPALIAEFAPGEALTLVIGPLAKGLGGAAASFTANGLAG